MAFREIKYKGRALRARKAIVSPNFDAETVLVADPWNYVELWLKRKRQTKAQQYWLQAREFAQAASVLPPTSAPVPAYYCFLNATKALLEVRGRSAKDAHGVHGNQKPSTTSLEGERVYIHSGGVLGSLVDILGENCASAEHSLKAALYNLPFIHRAFALTYTSKAELFTPIRNGRFVRKVGSQEAWFCAEVESRYATGHLARKLPEAWEVDAGVNGGGTVRLKARFKWDGQRPSSDMNRKRLEEYHRRVRKDVLYIYGSQRLWYLKRGKTNEDWIDRSPLTLTFAAMHRLSELSRYDPLSLRRHLVRQHNWLLTEFIEVAPTQFVDEIASELTGCDFLMPGIRK